LPSTSSVRYGRIVYARIQDRRGYTKLRPAIVLISDEEIATGGDLVVVAVTTTFADPPPAYCVPLPWHARGHPVTKLAKRSAAVCNWVVAISPEEIGGFAGDVPVKTMQLIQVKVREN
jgi:mRNA-degrading endonuclease toxin of MazEF toxin-antitoxin module